jgi:putative glycosyltransferase
LAAIALSVVTTLYRSAPHLAEFLRRATAAAGRLTSDYEIVLVNDGSPDDSLALAIELQRRDSHVRVVDLSRNFGHHPAMMTGLRHARGDLVFLLDSDLEEPPEWLGEFHARLVDSAADAVYGVQLKRRGGWFEKFTGWLFYTLVTEHLGPALPRNTTTARLMTRRFVDALLRFPEREHTVAALCSITGFAQEPVPVQKASSGRSTYSLAHRVGVLVSNVTSFSNRPLILVFYLGCVIVVVSGAAAAVLIWRRLVGGIGVPGYASLVVSVWLLGGLVIFCVGLVGIYLAKVFVEVKQRPPTIVRAEYPDHLPPTSSGDHDDRSSPLPARRTQP